jgi:rifampicin phosphotransferase
VKTSEAPNLLHMVSAPDTLWTTGNLAEAAPGIHTPLGWGIWGELAERAVVGVSIDLGARPRGYSMSENPGERFGSIFYGRYAACVNTFRTLGDRMPGSCGDAVEASFFGEKLSDLRNEPVPRRYPVVIAKLPSNLIRSPRKVARLRTENFDWWTKHVVTSPPADIEAAQAMLRDGARRFVEVMQTHMLVTMLAQASFDQLAALCRAVGLEGKERDLVSGYGGMEEANMIADLRALAGGSLHEGTFLDRHGYHGPSEGDVSSYSWREKPGPIRRMAQTFQRSDVDPFAAADQASEGRTAAEKLIRSRLRWHGRLGLSPTLAIARKFVLGREVGKAGFLLAMDGMRTAARSMGSALVDGHLLDQREDVFFLTLSELRDAPLRDRRDEVLERKALYCRYREFDLPENWRGDPTPVRLSERTSGAEDRTPVITGTGVSSGVVRGVVKVLLRADDDEAETFDAGDILVCRITDPSWAPMLSLAGAAVIDIGGAMSHGAIVARELGIPCIINTKQGTALLRTGDKVEVDGAAGTITLLSES